MAKERIDKLLAHEGFGSRKDIKKLLRASEVYVNDVRIYDPGFAVDANSDIIKIDDEEIDLHQNVYLMMNKIMHTISANKDGEHQTVFELLSEEFRTPYLQDKLHLIGRLDMDTEGLLLFTTDGTLTHRIISPKSHISKTYFVMLEKPFTLEQQQETEKRFAEGIEVGPDDNEPGFKCEPATVKWPEPAEIKKHLVKSSIAEVFEKHSIDSVKPLDETAAKLQAHFAVLTIYEGKYHQVKRMFTETGNKVIFLKRISMGKLQLDGKLNPGEYRYISEAELDKLS